MYYTFNASQSKKKKKNKDKNPVGLKKILFCVLVAFAL